MPFTLYVTFSGLCMVKKPGELRVLMPHAAGHETVVGSHVRYQPGAPAMPRFRELGIKNGEIAVDLQTTAGLSLDLSSFSLFNVSRATKKPAKHERARMQVILKKGAPCPPTVCEQSHGAIWEIEVDGVTEEVRMPTAIHWRVADVRNMVDGEEGLKLEFLGSDGYPGELVFRPVEENAERQIRIYFYNTPLDEHPSKEPPTRHKIKKGEANPHFRAYYKLYDGPDKTPDALFKNDGAPIQPKFVSRLLFLGRRLTCVVVEGDP
ncbi:MAG: hypothetical protein ACJ8GN_14545 [Longimicrobiaceae bacterium]